MACGGTGGHILPGLATADILVSRGHEVTLWLAGKDTEKTVIEGWSGPVVTVPAEGFSSLRSPAVFRTLWRLSRASRTCTRLMRRNRPDVLLAMGSYASAGPAWAAHRLGIPFVLHEANVIPGRAVRLFSRWAHTVAGCFEGTRFYLRRHDIVLTGMPLRAELARRAEELQGERAKSGIRKPNPGGKNPTSEGEHSNSESRVSNFRVLVMGGSRGAHRLNETVPRAIGTCRELGLPIEVVHLSGSDDEEAVRALYEAAGVPHRVASYHHDMAEIYASQDLAVCRAGAATCAELSAFGLPGLLVPYPHATADHQTFNARAMEKCGAADVVPDHELTGEWLKDYLASCIAEPERLTRMRAASRGRSVGHGAEALADVVETAAAEQRGG